LFGIFNLSSSAAERKAPGFSGHVELGLDTERVPVPQSNS
jgi:hypothetical protein